LHPVAVDSIFVFDLDWLWLCDAETEKGPYPTETLADVLEAEIADSRLAVLPENYSGMVSIDVYTHRSSKEGNTLSSTSAATMKAVGKEENC
jgi:hypothetical protein